MLRDDLKSRIDVCFNQVTMARFSRVYGADWFTKELYPYMKNIRSYSNDEKLIGDYERFVSHNNNFLNADTTICAKLLLFDERYSHLIGRAEGWQLLKHLLFLRNECSHSVQDISSNVYQDGLNSVERARRFFLNNTAVNNTQAVKARGNTQVDMVRCYYDGVRKKVRNIVAWFERILFVCSLAGVVLGCIFIFVHRENDLEWWMHDGLKVLPYVYIAYLFASIQQMLAKLDESWKYRNSTSRVRIIFQTFMCVVWTFVVNIGTVLVMLACMGLGVLSVKILEWLLGVVVKGISFPSMFKAGFVCFALFWPHIRVFIEWISGMYKKILHRKIEKDPALIYRCPKCKKKVRVANGVKKILISCPNCNKQFIRRRVWRNLFGFKK